MLVKEDKREETQLLCACVCICQPETFCLSSLLRTRPHSLAPVLLCLLSTGVCGWLDRLCWFWSTQQCCSRRSHTEFRFTSDTKISVIPKPQIPPFHQNTGGRSVLFTRRGGGVNPLVAPYGSGAEDLLNSTAERVSNSWYSVQKRKEWWKRREQDAAMVSLISLTIIPHWFLSLWAHSPVSCQHLLAVQSDFHNGKHRYRALERGREREEGGREGGEWMSSCCHWTDLFSRCWWTHLQTEVEGRRGQ